MNTQAEFVSVRKSHEYRLKELLSVYSDRSGSVHRDRALRIELSRIRHQFRVMSTEFNEVARRRGYLPEPSTLEGVLKNRYTPTVLAIMDLLLENKINLGMWIAAQAKMVRIKAFTLYHCFGENALWRYETWCKKYTRESDKKRNAVGFEESVRKVVIESHKLALSKINDVALLKPPSLSAALFFLFPQLPAWYLLCYPTVVTDVLESGFCTEPHLMKCWGMLQRSTRLQRVCTSALQEAEDHYGILELVYAS